jgi:YbbR domain-containing protein
VESVSPSTVDVQVRGANQQVLNLDPTAVGTLVNLSGATAGRTQFFLDVSVPPGVQSLQVTPAYVTVVLEPIIDRSRTVTVEVAGKPADGYQAGTAAVSPSQVIVHGPQSAVDKVASVVTTIDVGGATGDQVATATPKALDAAGKVVSGVTMVPAQVQVTVPVRQVVATRSLPVTVTVTGTPAAGFTVSGTAATPASVTVSGPATMLAGLTSVATAPVDVTGAKADVAVKASIVLPDGVTSVQPNQVGVVVHIK